MEWINNFWDIMLEPVNSTAMGFIGAVSAAVALIMNHYSWRRAGVLTVLAVTSLFGWFFVMYLIEGNLMQDPEVIRVSVATVILVFFLILGYWSAGVINYLHPNPARRLKRITIAILREIAKRIPSYKLSRPLEKKADKLEVIADIQKQEETLSEELILERMKQVISIFLV